MSRYNQYGGGFYDPVGSQAQQPSGYTYQSTTPAATSSSYPSTYQYGGNSYSSQQYGASGAQQASNSASHAAAALSSLSSHNYAQTSASSRSDTTGHQFESSTWYNGPTSTSNSYPSSNLTPPNRAQNNDSSRYAANSQGSSTFGRLNIPEQTQAGPDTVTSTSSYLGSQAASNTTSYPSAYTQQQQTSQQQQPPRYHSPLQAAQAQQHGQTNQASRSSSTHQPSPQMAPVHNPQQNVANRQQSASVEPSPATVDPSQVYDNRAELQRKAAVEADKRRKYEAEQVAKKAEEERKAAEQRKAEESKRKAEEEQRKAQVEAAKKAKQAQKAEERRRAREERKQSHGAATTPQTTASASPAQLAGAPDAGEDEEAMMRAMFQKMREFNARNPTMLAKLWEEERKNHAQAPAAQAPQAPQAAQVAAPSTVRESSSKKPHTLAAQAANAYSAGKPSEAATASASANTSSPVTQQRFPPVASLLTTPSAGSGSLWPAHMKSHLADATARWLRTRPKNANSVITSNTVLHILESNPSYVQLCERLEYLGMKFDRASLANHLMRATPDGTKAQPALNAATPAGESGRKSISADLPHAGQRTPASGPQNGAATVLYEAPLSLVDAAREVNGMGLVATSPPRAYGGPVQKPSPSPYFAQHPLASVEGSSIQSQSADIKPQFHAEEAAKPPADKEEAARKRTFGDLVDLTAEDSDDGEPMPKRVAIVPSKDVDGVGPQRSTNEHSVGESRGNHFSHNINPLTTYDVPGADRGSMGVQIPHDRHSAMPKAPLVPSQARNSAAQQQQQQPAPKAKGPNLEQQQHARMRGKMLVEPIMRDRVARKNRYDSKTIARDVLLATGRHPDMRGLNAHMATMQKLLGQHGGDTGGSGAEGVIGTERGNRSDLSTIKWDIVDAEAPTTADDGRAGRKIDAALHGDDKSGAEARGSTGKSAPQTVEHGLLSASTPSQPNGESRRPGRPPKKHSSPRASVAGPSTLTKTGLGDAPRDTSPASRACTPTGRTPVKVREKMPIDGPVGYAAFREHTPNGTIVKKKGRPVGWRKKVHSREAQGLAPKSSNSKQPPKLPDATRQVEPQYAAYNCAWRGCSAELHNLATLRKHMIKVHGSKSEDSDTFECWWASCPSMEGGERHAKMFDGIESWAQHVDTEHLKAVAWKLGDGPKADLAAPRHDSSPAPHAYLLDREGRSVTPLITPKSISPAAEYGQSANNAPRRSTTSASPPTEHFNGRIGRGRPPKDGVPRWERGAGMQGLDAPLKKLEEHKRLIGPTMDRMGCVLADDGRREGFLDDEDFEDEVEGSEHEMGDDESEQEG